MKIVRFQLIAQLLSLLLQETILLEIPLTLGREQINIAAAVFVILRN